MIDRGCCILKVWLSPLFLYLFIVILLVNQVHGRTLHITPLLSPLHYQAGSANLLVGQPDIADILEENKWRDTIVDLSGLLAEENFNRISTLAVQLEVDGPSWEFSAAKNTRDYFVGLTTTTSSSSVRISCFRYNYDTATEISNNSTGIKSMTSIVTIVIQDPNQAYWYEIKPDVDDNYIVTEIPDREVSPYPDAVVPKKIVPITTTAAPSTTPTAAATAAATPSALTSDEEFSGFIQYSRKLLRSVFPQIEQCIDDYLSVAAAEDDTIIDIMVVWTHSAECIKSHLPAECERSARTRQHMKLAVKFFLQETNTAFANSGVHVKLRLVHTQRVPYQETTFRQALEDLTDGEVPTVSARRQQHKADMVLLLMDNTHDYPETGLAYNNYDHVDDEDYMYSVVATQYTSVWFLPAHELAHNFGCSHDRGTLGMCHDQENTNYGYRDPEGRFRTIMSYPCQARECNHQHSNSGRYANCPLIPYFSNNHPGSGYAGISSLGGPANNCAGQIQRVKEQIANLY